MFDQADAIIAALALGFDHADDIASRAGALFGSSLFRAGDLGVARDAKVTARD
jgi:hypothetical protein